MDVNVYYDLYDDFFLLFEDFILHLHYADKIFTGKSYSDRM